MECAGFREFMQCTRSVLRNALRSFFPGLLACALLLPLAAAAQEPVVIGQLASLSNPVTKLLAGEYHAGLQLAVRRINAAGGVQGRRLMLTLLDDQFNPDLTLALAQQLVDRHGAVALVGGLGTQTTLRLVTDRFLERHHLACFAPLTGLPEALSAAHVFPIRASFNDEVKAMFAHAAGLGRKRVAFVYYKAGAGPALSGLVPQWAGAAGITLSANLGFEQRPEAAMQQQAIRDTVAALGDLAPDAVVLIAVGPAHSAAVKALRERFGAWLPVYSLGQVNTQEMVRLAGPDAARGVSLTQVMPSPGSVDKMITRDFAADRLRWNADMPSTYVSLEGYVAGRVLGEILARARPLTREGVLAAAHAAGELQVADFRVRYSEQARLSLQAVDMTLVGRDGRLLR